MSYSGYEQYQNRSSGSAGTWLALSIGSTLCCCMPFGVVGIVFSALAMSAAGRGDLGEYYKYLGRAKGWTVASIVVGLVGILIGFALQAAGNST
jgi:hypothetical protein